VRAVILFFEVFAVPVPAVIVPAEPELVGTSEFRSEPERGTGSVPSLSSTTPANENGKKSPGKNPERGLPSWNCAAKFVQLVRPT